MTSWYRGIITALVALGLIGTGTGSVVGHAASTTPFGPERFTSNHATYVITTRSTYYRRIWESAISAWNKTGAFHFRAGSKSRAQIVLGTASGSEATTMGGTLV